MARIYFGVKGICALLTAIVVTHIAKTPSAQSLEARRVSTQPHDGYFQRGYDKAFAAVAKDPQRGRRIIRGSVTASIQEGYGAGPDCHPRAGSTLLQWRRFQVRHPDRRSIDLGQEFGLPGCVGGICNTPDDVCKVMPRR